MGEGQSPADRWHKAGTGLELVGTAQVTQHMQGTVGDTEAQVDLDLKALTAEIRHAYHTVNYVKAKWDSLPNKWPGARELGGLERDRCIAEAALDKGFPWIDFPPKHTHRRSALISGLKKYGDD